ncbi:hypothetical protein AVEN_158615-1 [Araneus ventricosus]|uniref:Uncharacterized protein n=1 Tax=Araneus ventricosus TaxID=182803 RepID=A0A4Y2WMQ2_ARAVE|nr:hypothetical protein AVEN_158615-1 [Araneus ventricosus]
MKIFFQISVPPISEKGNSHWVIMKLSDANSLACGVMVSSSYMTIPILLAKLKNSCESSSGKSGAIPLQPNLGSKHLSGTSFSSESDVVTVVEIWLNGQDVISAKLG